MRSRLAQLSLSGAICLAAACAGQKNADNPKGTLRIDSSASAFDTASGSEEICAHFTLQPYAPSADGTPVLAGDPISFDSTASANDAGASTQQILGCIDGDNDSAGYNWGYIVTADTFSACSDTADTLGALLTNASPSTSTFIVQVHCEAGVDNEVPILVPVAISSANSGGYIDISVGVNATDTQVGCKQADLGITDHLLHFGESYISSDGSTATGLVALDTGAPNQFGGTVGTGLDIDTYYTGDIDSAVVDTIYQTFVNPCSDPTQEIVDRNHAQCVSDNSGSPGGTSAQLADAFIALPGSGFASASIVGGDIVVYSALSASGPAIMTAGTGFTADYNTLVTTTIPGSDPSLFGFTPTGIFVDQGNPMQFFIAAQDPSGTPVYASMSAGSGAWTVGAFTSPTSSIISCNGLYAAPASCLTLNPLCPPPGSGSRINPGTGHITPVALTHTLGGTISGLTGSGLVLADTGEANLGVAASASTFAFASLLLSGTSYAVSIAAQPAGQTCVINNNTGTMASSNVSSVVVACGPSSWTAFAEGQEFVVAIAADGSLWSWGYNGEGELGLGNTTDVHVPTRIGTSTWIAVAASYQHAAAVRSDGTLWTWGLNDYGQLADGTLISHSAPEQIGADTNWTQVACGFWNTYALKSTGTLWAAGGNDQGMLGNGTLIDSQVLVQTGSDSDWAQLSAGGFDGVGIKQNHTLWTWPSGASLTPSTSSYFPGQVGTDSDWKASAGGVDFTILVKTTGQLWAAGDDYFGSLGDGAWHTMPNIRVLERIGTDSDWASVGSGTEFAGAIKSSGALYTWGWNNTGVIGNGTNGSSLALTSPTLVGSGYASFGAGNNTSLAIKTDHSLWAWGFNATGALGNGTVTNNNSPHLVP